MEEDSCKSKTSLKKVYETGADDMKEKILRILLNSASMIGMAEVIKNVKLPEYSE
jgi:uncharacterized protein Yka (UPF0111/DUF47 family)